MKKNWSVKQQINFFEDMGEFLQCGYSLYESLQLQMNNEPSQRQKQLEPILFQIQNGIAISVLLQSLHFHPTLLFYLKIFEKKGELSLGFLEGATILRKRLYVLEQTKQKLYYPLFLLLSFFTFSFLYTQFFLPQMMQFQTTSIALFSTIQVCLTVFQIMVTCSLLIGSGLLLFRHSLQRIQIREQWLQRIPFFRYIVQFYFSYFFSFIVSQLLQAGFTFLEAIRYTPHFFQQSIFQQHIQSMSASLQEGGSLYEVVSNEMLLRKDFSLFIRKGFQQGQLTEELIRCTVYYDKKMVSYSERFLSLIQPILLLVVSVILMSLYVAFLVPMYAITNTLL